MATLLHRRVIVHALIFIMVQHVLAREERHPNISDVDRLIKEKRADYNVFLRPKINQSEPVVIYMAFDLIAIRDFDEVKERFSVVGTIYMVWKDERMSWDPEEYGNLYTFITEHRDFWVPTLILVNAFERFEKVGHDEYWPARFYHGGEVLYHPGQVFTTTCPANVKLYPFDTQRCGLLYTVWAHDASEVTLLSYDNMDKVSLTYFGSNGEWDLIDTHAGLVAPNLFMFEFVMRRKPLFIVVNTLIPIIFMSFLNILAFLIPIDSGERLSYCITVLLAVAVFLTIIGDSLPQSATTIAVLCYYLVCVLALSMFIILGTILSMRIHHRGDDKEVSRFWTRFVNFMRCRGCRSRRYTRQIKRQRPRPQSVNEDFTLYTGKAGNLQAQNGDTKHLNSISGMNNKFATEHSLRTNDVTSYHYKNGRHAVLNDTRSLESEDEIESKKYTWRDVSGALDLLFFIISFLLLVCFTATFFIYTMTSSDKEEE